MKTRAITRNVHISPRKANLVCALIRGKNVSQALTILQNAEQKTAKFLCKLLTSAMSNATNNHSMNVKNLFVYEAKANQGRTDKRTMPRAKGSANLIRKRHCHLEIVLSDDANQRQIDLQAIKIRLAKRAKGKAQKKANQQPKKPAAPAQKVELGKKDK